MRVSSLMDRDALEVGLRSFLRNELGLGHEVLPAESELLTTGLIDSTDLVRLAAYLERTLEITIPDRDIQVEHFDSIAKMLDYAASRQGVEVPPG